MFWLGGHGFMSPRVNMRQNLRDLYYVLIFPIFENIFYTDYIALCSYTCFSMIQGFCVTVRTLRVGGVGVLS